MPGAFSPIPETQIGAIAYLYGILNNGTPISITGIASFELESMDVTLTWEEKIGRDTTGFTQNITQTDQKYEQSIKFTPSGATRTAAANVGDGVFALANLVIANCKQTTLNGQWRIKPGTKLNLKAGDYGSMDINAEKYVNVSQNAALTAAAIVG